MPKFFVKPEQIDQNHIVIYDEDVKHITKVLRLNENDIIIICDECGKDYKVRIKKIQKDKIYTNIIESYDSLTEPPINVVLYQGIPKSAKMEYIIQKTTELGILRIVPVVTERTVVKLDDKRQEHKIERWRKVAYEAAKQSNRGVIPQVDQSIGFNEAIQQMSCTDLGLMLYEKERDYKLKNVLQCHSDVKSISIFIGPEGGFSEKEVEQAQLQGLNTVGLGPRILRTETAGVAVLAILMYELKGM